MNAEVILMNPLQQRVFQMFVALGDERSIPRLVAVCREQGIEQAEITLKRWAAKFKWQELALHTDHVIAQKIADNVLPDHMSRTRRALEYIEKMKETFYKKIDDGTVDLSLSDFLAVLKSEQLLQGAPTERSEHVHTTKVQIDLTQDELNAAIRIAAAKQRGLPAPTTGEELPFEERVMLNVTPANAAL